MKKVLIITYHWPPSGGITVLRCLKFVKYLRDFGWEPVVFTASNAAYQFLDYNNEQDIPENIEIHKVPITEPVNLFKKLSGRKIDKPLQNITSNSTKKRSSIDVLSMWIRGNFFIPDARYLWIKPSVKYLEKYLKNNKIDAILTDGPPHTNTVIGMRLSQKFNIPWLADFQDPWTQVDYFSQLYIGRSARNKHLRLEQEVFKTAKKITIASPSWKTDLESIGAKNVDVIYYGYDETDFKNYKAQTNDTFILFHGGLLGEDRNPIILFEELGKLIKNYPELNQKVSIRLAGEVDHSIRVKLEETNLIQYTEFLGMIPRKEVLHEYAQASLLLLPINKAENAAGRIPGKLFELLRAEKPILVFGPTNGDVKKIVESKEKGISFEYDDRKGIAFFLHTTLIKQEQNRYNSSISIDEFSNKNMTSLIANYLNEISNK